MKIHQLLGLSGILKPSEAVVTPLVRQTVSIHLTGKQLPTIDADLDTEGKPRLNASIHEAKDGVCEVVVGKDANICAEEDPIQAASSFDFEKHRKS